MFSVYISVYRALLSPGSFGSAGHGPAPTATAPAAKAAAKAAATAGGDHTAAYELRVAKFELNVGSRRTTKI